MSVSPIRLHGTRVTTRIILPLRPGHERIRNMVCFEDNGVLLYEGDIVVDRASRMMNLAPRATIRLLGHIMSDQGKTWPNGIVPVDVPADMQSIVNEAISVWEDATPLRFPTMEYDRDYLSFVWSSRNASKVGCKTGPQVIELEEGVTVRTVVHEIGHAIGLYHEHSRPDAHEHIEVHTENLVAHADVQFTQPASSRVDGPYDYDSIMHYDAYAFSSNGQPTITAHNGSTFGQSNALSIGDIQACSQLYRNLNWS